MRAGLLVGDRTRTHIRSYTVRTLHVPTPMAPSVIIMVSETMSSSPLRKAKMEASFDFCLCVGYLCVLGGGWWVDYSILRLLTTAMNVNM